MESVSNESLSRSCLDTISKLVCASSSLYYLVDEKFQPYNYIINSMPENIHQQYLSHFKDMDPLRPERFQQGNVVITSFSDKTISDNRDYYNEFMLPNQQQDIIEIFIRDRRRIVAGISLIRDKKFTAAEHTRTRAALPLFQLITRDFIPNNEVVTLTAKEHEIVELVRDGDCNKIIAIKLGISVSTVKTHLRSIFSKAHITNRTELVSNKIHIL